MNHWWRSWHGAPTDNKWLVIARKAGVQPIVVSAVAWALFDHASQAKDRGSVKDFDAETYSAFAGCDEQDVINVITAMRDKGIISPDDRLTNWEKRQPKREDDSIERVRNWREKHEETPEPQPPADVTQCNAEKRNVTQRNAPDTDTDTDTEIAAHTPPAPVDASETDTPAKSKKRVIPLNGTYELAKAIAHACSMDFESNKGRLLKEAQLMAKAEPHPTPELVAEHYEGMGSWWFTQDWRGRKMERPSPPTLRQTWGMWDKEKPQEIPVEVYR